LVKRFGERNLISCGLLSMVFGLGLLPFMPSVSFLLLCMVPLTFGHGVSNPSIASLISKSSSSADQGGVLGVSQSMASLARILGPTWGGFVYDQFGYQYPYLTGGFFMLLAFVLSVTARQRQTTAQE
jgi:MFS transporter, DHA1 family, tetracycline resistance protein